MFGEFVFPDEEMTRPHWDNVSKLQKSFMMWFNEERNKTLFTFPVESFALVYKDGDFVDKDSADFVAEEYARGHSFFTYMSDTVDSLSSCCFEGKTMVTYSLDGEKWLTEPIECVYERFSDSSVLVRQPKLNGDGTINGFEANSVSMVKAEAIQEVFIYLDPIDGNTNESDNVIRVTPDHLFPILKDGHIKNEYAYLLQQDDVLIDEIHGTRKIARCYTSDCEKQNFYCFRFGESEEQPYFILPNGIVSHNCRLKNKIQTKEFNFTNGNIGIQTGSKSVISMNLSRITQDWYASLQKKYGTVDKKNISLYYDDMKEYYKPMLERIYKYHIAYNEWLWDMYDAGLLPVYKAGFISLDKQYLTIGLNGLNAAAEFLGMECSDNDEYALFCQTLFGFIKEQNQLHSVKFNGHKLTFNTEQVPAESLAAKNYNWDKEDGYWVPEDLNLYGSYIFKPNDAKRTLWEKLRMHGNRFIGDYLDGGSACHINLEKHLTVNVIKKIMKYCIKHGCQYWTFNVINAKCDDCGYIAKTPFDVCPKCGSKHISYYDRIIGYLTKIANWAAARQLEQGERVYIKDEDIIKEIEEILAA